MLFLVCSERREMQRKRKENIFDNDNVSALKIKTPGDGMENFEH